LSGSTEHLLPGDPDRYFLAARYKPRNCMAAVSAVVDVYRAWNPRFMLVNGKNGKWRSDITERLKASA